MPRSVTNVRTGKGSKRVLVKGCSGMAVSAFLASLRFSEESGQLIRIGGARDQAGELELTNSDIAKVLPLVNPGWNQAKGSIDMRANWGRRFDGGRVRKGKPVFGPLLLEVGGVAKQDTQAYFLEFVRKVTLEGIKMQSAEKCKLILSAYKRAK